MNRATRRKTDKELRSKLTDEQYKNFKDKAIQEYIESEIEKGRNKTTLMLTESLEEVLSKKDYRISEDRKNRILNDFLETLDKKVKQIKGSESR